jgi:tetratricopeptide (TPR) repeat protein
MAEIPAPALSNPLRERQAFYLMAAGKYDAAAQAYAKVWPKIDPADEGNLARVGLAYGFSLFKSKLGDNPTLREASAAALLTEAARRASGLAPIKKGADRLVDFSPKRIELAAQGLLAQMGPPLKRVAALQERARLLENAKNEIDDWAEAVIQNHVRLAAALVTAGDAKQARQEMQSALRLAHKLGETSGFLGQATYMTAMNEMALGLSRLDEYRQPDARERATEVKALVDGCLTSYDQIKTAAPALDIQRTKLQVLWAAYAKKIAQQPAAPEVDAVMAGPVALRLRASAPAAWSELNALAKAIR